MKDFRATVAVHEGHSLAKAGRIHRRPESPRRAPTARFHHSPPYAIATKPQLPSGVFHFDQKSIRSPLTSQRGESGDTQEMRVAERPNRPGPGIDPSYQNGTPSRSPAHPHTNLALAEGLPGAVRGAKPRRVGGNQGRVVSSPRPRGPNPRAAWQISPNRVVGAPAIDRKSMQAPGLQGPFRSLCYSVPFLRLSARSVSHG